MPLRLMNPSFSSFTTPFCGRTVVAVSGKQRAGKDTFASVLIAAMASRGDELRRVGLADAIKTEWGRREGLGQVDDVISRTDAELISLVDDLKNRDAAVRAALIEYGQSRKRRNPALWAERVLHAPGDIVVPDMRFFCEVEAFLRESLFQTTLRTRVLFVRIECPREVRLERAIAAGGTLSNEDDSSETELDNFDGFDFTIHNVLPGALQTGAALVAATLRGEV
jgi:hypothetical protein